MQTPRIRPTKRGKWLVIGTDGRAITRPCPFVDACFILRYITGGAAHV
jgi:hypothetical protein